MAKKKAAPKKGKPKAAPKSKAKPGRARQPRAQGLPTMETVRYADLDELCQELGDVRDQMADLEKDEAAYLQSALKAMRKHDRTQYTFAGIRLTRLTGDEKITCRRLKASKAEQSPETETAQGDLGDAAASGE